MNISPYEEGNRFNVDPLRPRRLLLHKREIRKLIGYTTQDGLTVELKTDKLEYAAGEEIDAPF